MNPDIAKAGENTQLGKPNGPKRGGDKAWSIRNQIRYIAAQKIDLTAADAITQIYGKYPTVAQQIAFKALVKAYEADMKAVEFADERIDGKLPQTSINADLERIKSMSDEEISAELQRIDRELEGLSAGAEDELAGTQESAACTQTEAASIQSPSAS